MASYKIACLVLTCFVAVSYQASLQKGIASVEKAIESEDMALIKTAENALPAPAKKIVEAEVASAQGLEKDIKAEEKKIMGKLNGDLVSLFKGGLETLETGKMSFGPAQKTIKDIMAIDNALVKDSIAEAGKLMGSAKKVVAAEMGTGKSVQGILKQEAGQAKKIGSDLLKADEALATGLAKEEGQLLTGNFDTTGLVKDEEQFAKSLIGAEQEAAKDAQMDVSAAIKA